MDITPLTPLEELCVSGHLGRRALQCCERLHLALVRDVASFHYSDPRYTTMAGCGKRTARELNAAIKAAYGRFPTMKQIDGWSNEGAGEMVPAPGSWQSRWESMSAQKPKAEPLDVPSGSVAAEWEADGTLTHSELLFARKCADYARFILDSHGVPHSVSDIERHRWYLRNYSSRDHLGSRYRMLFEELLGRVGEEAGSPMSTDV